MFEKTGKKVRTAVFGKDLRVELKDYPLSAAGNKINIVDAGAGYFMPEIGPNQFLDWPIRKKYLLFGPWVYKRTFIVLKRGTKCIDFSLDSPEAYGPDIEQIDQAIGTNLASQIGADVNKGTPWYIWISLIMLMLILVTVLRIAGVIVV